MSGNSNKIIAVNYFGGKYQFLDELYSYFPDHTHFVDLFSGSMSVSLNKKPSMLDTANDLDGDVFNFFKVLRDTPDELFRVLHFTPVGRQEYIECFPVNGEGVTEIERARRFFVRCRQSFQGSGLKEHTGFNACINTSEKNMSKNVAKFYSAIDRLPEVVDRLKRIQIENMDYRQCIEKYDTAGTFFYVDPPYELRKRNYKKWYNIEFEKDCDHIELFQNLKNIKGKAMVSGYESEMYLDLYKDWHFIKLKPRKHSMKGAKLQEECIWVNYDPFEKSGQKQLNFEVSK